MFKNYSLISFTGCDGSWKSTIISWLLQNPLFYDYKNMHYYSLVMLFAKSKLKKKVKTPNGSDTTCCKYQFYKSIKEVIYWLVLFSYLFVNLKILKKKIILDRTFLDVYIDISSKLSNYHKYEHILWILLILNKLFLKLFSEEKHIYLETGDFIINYNRKMDEELSIFELKYRMYTLHKNNYSNYQVINTTLNSIEQSLWIILH